MKITSVVLIEDRKRGHSQILERPHHLTSFVRQLDQGVVHLAALQRGLLRLLLKRGLDLLQLAAHRRQLLRYLLVLVPGNLRLGQADFDRLFAFFKIFELLFADGRPPGIDLISEGDHPLKLFAAI